MMTNSTRFTLFFVRCSSTMMDMEAIIAKFGGLKPEVSECELDMQLYIVFYLCLLVSII